MPEIAVVIVEPKSDGNVGAVARAMKNFGFGDLRLVLPCDIGEEAFKRALHARDVLDSARSFADLDGALEDCTLVAGTSAIETWGEKRFIRIPMPPKEFSQRISEHEGRVALLLGREDYGLYNEELKRCDFLVRIPTSDAYPVMNISHAAGILLYELFLVDVGKRPVRVITDVEREKLHEFFHELLMATKHAPHKLERTEVMFRRLVGRAVLSKWEYHILMGVFGDAVKRIRRGD